MAKNYGRAVLLGMGGFYFGYYIAVFNPLSKPVLIGVLGYDEVKDAGALQTLNGMTNFLFAIGATIGVLLTGQLADRFGRLALLYAGEVLALLCIVPYVIATTPALLIARVISGIVAGVNSSIFTIIMAEWLPNSVCGFGNGFGYAALSLGSLMSFLSQNVLDYQGLVDYWRVVLVYPQIVSIVRLILFPFFIPHDTPKYLFMRSKTKEEGEQLVRRSTSLIYNPAATETNINTTVAFLSKQKEGGKLTLSKLFSKKYRLRLFSGCFVSLAQQISGINYFYVYSTAIFDDISNNGKVVTLIIGISNMIGALAVPYLISKLGRKTNLVVFCAAQVVGMYLVPIGWKSSQIWLMEAGVAIYIFGFAVGLGGTETAYVGEILPPAGIGLALALHWLGAALVMITSPPLIEKVGNLALMIFYGSFCAFATVILIIYTIETKGKTEEQIEHEFENFGRSQQVAPEGGPKQVQNGESTTFKPLPQQTTEKVEHPVQIQDADNLITDRK